MWWQQLLGIALGGGLTLVGVWVTARLNLKERRLERRLQFHEQRRAFQRENLMALGKAMTQVMRDAALVHFADVDAAKTTGIYAGHLLPKGLTPEKLDNGQEFARRAALVLDDDLRNGVQAYDRNMRHLSLGKRTLAEGEAGSLALVDEHMTVSADLSNALRDLWSDADPFTKPSVQGRH